ncbi:MAG: thioredoxin family protein [Eubacteriales bacterium]|nr:thioredoxin family protein [Eubacteriales bacterium]
MIMFAIDDSNDLERLIQLNEIVVALMSDMSCNVCLAIYPELEAMSRRYSNVIFASADVASIKTLVGQHMIFLYPTIIVFVMGKETVRFERVFSLKDVESAINRYTEILH